MPPRRLSSLTVITAATLALHAGPAAAQGWPGDLDRSFNGTGWMKAQPNGTTSAGYGLAVQPDGKLVMAGHSGAASQLTVWRLHPDGAPDTSFNDTGIASLTGLPGADCVALRSDGRIFAGSSTFSGGNYLVAAFLPDGLPDDSFGNPPGRAISSFTGIASHMVLQPDNKILAAGGFSFSGSMVRFLPNGGTDTTFGSAGRVFLPDACTCLALQSDGKILAGYRGGHFTIRRFLPGGEVDTGFGQNGTAKLDGAQAVLQGADAGKIIVRADGKILVAGDYGHAALTNYPAVALMRLLPNGTPDATFGDAATPGLVRPSFSALNATRALTTTMVVQNDGRLLLAGMTYTAGNTDLALARCTAAGVLDPSFGTGGLIIHDMESGSYDAVQEAVLLPGGKLLVGGSIRAPGSPDSSLLLARVLTEPGPVLSAEGLEGSDGTVEFGTVTIGSHITGFGLRNHTALTLTNIQAALTDESHPGEYQVTMPPAGFANLDPGATLFVIVSLTPAPAAASGPRTASLRFTAGNSSLPPLIVPLTGAKATDLEIWRYTWFGGTEDFGAGADANDFDGDGLPNFMEYATLTHPHKYSAYPCQPAGPGTFRYTRPAAALTEFSYIPESAPSPAGPWSATGLTSTILTDSSTVQTVQVTATGASASRLFLRLRVSKR